MTDGIERQGARKADALALSAGERMRVAAHRALVEPHQGQQILDPHEAFVLRADSWIRSGSARMS